jgi:ABC-type branched-subunit amino acid transport system substrate-binding protein
MKLCWRLPGWLIKPSKIVLIDMKNESIKIGVLFSQSGHMTVTENAHLQGIILACEEINDLGGIDDRLLEPIILNPAGSDRSYAEMATELLLKHKVNAIFGCCLSTSRKAVIPIVERFNGVLFYPSVYEGFEYSPNIIYGGAVPNQIILPLLEYIYQHHGRKIVLLGSDTLYSREINRIVKEFLAGSNGEVVAESYFPFGTRSEQMGATLKQLADKSVDSILSTVVGEDSVTLYNAFAKLDLFDEKLHIASLTTTESELAKMDVGSKAGHFSVSPYFASLDTGQNENFVTRFQEKFGEQCVPGVYSEVCYSLVHIFANAVRACGNTETDNILQALSGAVFKSPGGDLSIDIDTNHFMLRPCIGKSNKDGGFEIVWKSPSVIRPDPYMVSYDRSLNDHMVR